MTDKPKEKTAREWFGLDGGEFLNTGMTLEEWFAARQLERIAASYVVQPGHEQRRRREYALKLVRLGTEIKAKEMFGSIVADTSFVHVLEGDWERVREDIEWCHFRNFFADDDVEAAEARSKYYADLWEPFRKLLEEAYAGRIEPDQDATRH